MRNVLKEIDKNYEGDNRLIAKNANKFCHNNIFGIEINEKIARVAMMDMIVNDDGHTNIVNDTGLNTTFKNPSISYDKFTIIMTNPPFGVKINKNDSNNLGENSFSNFEFGKDKTTQVSDILFLEQYKKLLVSDYERNPRAGIVVSDGVINNPSSKDVVLWIKRNFKILAVISLPDFAFRKAGSGMKTSLLFLKKYSKEYKTLEDVPDYNVFFGIAEHIGYDSTLRDDDNDFPIILDNYKNGIKDKEKKCFIKKMTELGDRLDPWYYYNMDKINEYFKKLEEKGHTIVSLATIVSAPVSGKSPKGGVTYSTGEIPSIVVKNITKEGSFDFENNLNHVPEDFYEEFIKSKGCLKLNDILIAKDGATTGKTAIIDENFKFLEKEDGNKKIKAIYSEHVFKISVKEGINAMYVNAFLNSEYGQLQLTTIASGGAQGGIISNFADTIRIPLIERKDQDKCANEWIKSLNDLQKLQCEYNDKLTDMKKHFSDHLSDSNPASEDYQGRIIK